MLILYRLFSFLAAPLILLFLKKRQGRGKEHAVRMMERWGRSQIKRPAGTLVWLHAASVGETQSALPLIRRLLGTYPDLHLMLTTGTVSSETFVAPKLPSRAFHQFIPVDSPLPVSRFLRHWHPDLAIWIESELWPNLLLQTRRSGCPLALINARMSEKSFRAWRRFPKSIHMLLDCFTVVTAQTGQDEARLEALGARQVLMPGNLKEDAEPLSADPAKLAWLTAQIGDRALWLAASTHFGEETLLAQAHKKLLETYKDLLLIIVPRHPPRGEKIAVELDGLGLRVALRSRDDAVNAQTQAYVADTIGELGVFYRLAPIVFMGGSLIPHGGQNPLEAARLNAALITGPHTHNFPDIYSSLEAENALIRTANTDEIANAVTRLLADKSVQTQLAANALQDAQSRQGALTATLDILAPFIAGKKMP
jgi:3-deoxy-D-manno-octulosonic-acid transferase